MSNSKQFFKLEDSSYNQQYKENIRSHKRLESYKVIGLSYKMTSL